MVGYSDYNLAVDFLNRLPRQYEKLNKNIHKEEKNLLQKKMNRVSKKLFDLINTTKDQATQKIDTYYKSGFRASFVWFFNSTSTNSITEQVQKQQQNLDSIFNTIKNTEDISAPVTKPTLTNDDPLLFIKSLKENTTAPHKTNSEEEEKKLETQLGKELSDIDETLMSITDNDNKAIENRNKLTLTLDELFNNVTNTWSNDVTHAKINAWTQQIANLNKSLKKIDSPKIDDLDKKMENLRVKVNVKLEPFGNKKFPLPSELKAEADSLSKYSEKEKIIRKDLLETKKAAFELAKKSNPHFKILVDVSEAINYRIANKKIGFSDDFLESLTENSEIDFNFGKDIKERLSSWRHSTTITTFLQKNLNGRTWNLFSEAKKTEICKELNKILIEKTSSSKFAEKSLKKYLQEQINIILEESLSKHAVY